MLDGFKTPSTTNQVDDLEKKVRKKLGPEHRTSSAWQITLGLMNENTQQQEQITQLKQQLEHEKEAKLALEEKLNALMQRLKIQNEFFRHQTEQNETMLDDLSDPFDSLDLEQSSDESLHAAPSHKGKRKSVFSLFGKKGGNSNASSPTSSPRSTATPPNSPKNLAGTPPTMRKSATAEGLPRALKKTTTTP